MEIIQDVLVINNYLFMSKMKLPPRLPPKPIPSKNSKNRYNYQHIDLTKLIDSNYS